MKKLQQLVMLGIFTSSLVISVYAGDGIIHTLKTEPPPTPTPRAISDVSASEDIITIGVQSGDAITEIALSLLQGVLALF